MMNVPVNPMRNRISSLSLVLLEVVQCSRELSQWMGSIHAHTPQQLLQGHLLLPGDDGSQVGLWEAGAEGSRAWQGMIVTTLRSNVLSFS